MEGGLTATPRQRIGFGVTGLQYIASSHWFHPSCMWNKNRKHFVGDHKCKGASWKVAQDTDGGLGSVYLAGQLRHLRGQSNVWAVGQRTSAACLLTGLLTVANLTGIKEISGPCSSLCFCQHLLFGANSSLFWCVFPRGHFTVCRLWEKPPPPH